MLSKISTSRKLKNRNQYMMKKKIGSWGIKNRAELLNWASRRMCQTKEAFFSALGDHTTTSLESLPSFYRNQLLFLETFSHSCTNVRFSHVFISNFNCCSSVVRNVRQAIQHQQLKDPYRRVSWPKKARLLINTSNHMNMQSKKNGSRSYAMLFMRNRTSPFCI